MLEDKLAVETLCHMTVLSQLASEAIPPFPLEELHDCVGLLYGEQLSWDEMRAAQITFIKILVARELANEEPDLHPGPSHFTTPTCIQTAFPDDSLCVSDGENDGDDEDETTESPYGTTTAPIQSSALPRPRTPPTRAPTSAPTPILTQTPTPKPTPNASSQEDAPPAPLLDSTVWRLRSGSRLTGPDVFGFLCRFVSLCPFEAIAVDPLLIDKSPSPTVRDQIAEASRIVLVPVHLAEMQHWVLVVLRAPNKLALLDSLPTDDMDEICERVEAMQIGLLSNCGNKWGLDSPEVYRVECAPQNNSDDGAVALLVNAIHMLTRTDPFSSIGYHVWRRVLAAWIDGGTCILDDSLYKPLRVSLDDPRHARLAKDKLVQYEELQDSAAKVAKVLACVSRLGDPLARHDGREQPPRAKTNADELPSPAAESQAVPSELLTELIQSQAALELLESRRFRNPRMETDLKECIAALERQHRECLANRGHVERILGQLQTDMTELQCKMRYLRNFVEQWK
ncbi:hypothetical protein QQZ08_009161 [Neonectria magnoliae]|uniref:Ubiquitin-like protease family profile domain-containing protein n=1 Tax=Neonectria magnoliae TaxID=2732573 RepID=A0ABR1HPV0_9HYPO